ncbi:Small GTPase Cdc42 [Mycena sanguinolenta]|uniref:Small GTPase Cdc42 n=1 Tax=Mycena sanguinolenta TaxID=230812 RepID=A0A8H6Y7V1_9AGAR|nr:Small GTPase Cdc42 [Mycena sanguinolenta]
MPYSPTKVVLVGDDNVGKTSMVATFTSGRFPTPPALTVFDSYCPTINVRGEEYLVCLFDTACADVYAHLRPLSYPQTGVFLVCFSVTSRTSYLAVRSKWVPEVRHYCPDVPFLVVATKIDLREDSKLMEELARGDQRPVSSAEGEILAYELGAVKYLECSALTNSGFHNVFEEAIIVTLDKPVPPQKKKARCVIDILRARETYRPGLVQLRAADKSTEEL